MLTTGEPTAAGIDARAADGRLRAAAWALLALHAAIAWLGRAPGILTAQDDSRYLLLGRALLEHGQYRDLMWPGAPYHHMYPPGYPLLLAAWGALGGYRFDWLVVLQIALSAGALALAYDAVRRVTPPVVALCALAILAVNPEQLTWAGQVASEPALALCFALAAWGAVALPPGRRQVAVVLAAALAAPMMRTAGIVLAPAVVVAWVVERRYRDALLAAVAGAIVIVPLLVWTLLADPVAIPGSSYAADLAGRHAAASVPYWKVLAQRFATNAVYYPTQGIPWLLPLPTVAGTVADNVVAALVVVAGLAAGVAIGVRRFRLGTLAVLATGALLLVWPYRMARYLTPVLPLVVPLLLMGVAWIAARASRRAVVVATLALTLVVVATSTVRARERVAAVSGCARGGRLPDVRCLGAEDASFIRAAAFVRDSLPATARILSAKSEPLNLYTGRTTAPLARLAGADSAYFWTALEKMGVEYALLGALESNERPLLAHRLRERCGELTLVRAFPPHTYLFRLPPPPRPPSGAGPASPSTGGCEAIARYARETAPPATP